MTRIHGKTALVTGAAHGIGKAISTALVAAGARVLVTDIDAAAADATARELGAAAFELDVTDADAARALRDRIQSEIGELDIVVNNAGYFAAGPFLETDLDEHLRTYAINVHGTVTVTHAFLPVLIGRPEAHVVNVVSASAYLGVPYGTTYASSKWGALGFSESLRAELWTLGHRNVRVCAICPSFVDTRMFGWARAPRWTPKLRPEDIGRHVVRAIERDRSCVRTPFMIKLTPLTRELLPTALWDRFARWFGVYRALEGWRDARRG